MAASRTSPPPRMYFSLRSPYSWLALHDLVTGHQDLVTAIDWRPAWEPDPESEARLQAAGGRVIYTPMSREKHFYMLGDVRRLAEQRGLRIDWPVDHSPRWEVSNLAYLAAAEAGAGREFALAVTRARWEHAADISDPATVAGIGAELGLDPDRLARAVENPALIAAGTQCLLAMYRDGVFGVPFFVHRREKFWGVDRLGAFLDRVRASTVATAADPGPRSVAAGPSIEVATVDDGHAGGCG